MCPVPPRGDAPYNDLQTAARKEKERIDVGNAQRLREMQQQGLDVSEPERYCREFHRIITPRQMGKPEALARMRSDPCAFPNEWPCNLAEHNRRHIPLESRQWDWRQEVAAVQAPALVIHGAEDLIPLGASQERAAVLPEARLLVIPASGHFPLLEVPLVTFQAIDRFLAGEWSEGARE